MRAPIYVTNEAIEMEMGVKKITDLYKRSVLIQIGKTWLEENQLHGTLMRMAINWNTATINSWRMILGSIGIGDFQEISNIARQDIDNWKKFVNKWINVNVIGRAKIRTQIEKSFPTM